MRKIILIVAMTALSNSVSAQSYVEANVIQRACDDVGKITEYKFTRLKKYNEIPTLDEDTFKDKKVELLYAKIYLDIAKGVDTLDAPQAYMIGWSHCMDHIRKAGR